MTRKAFDLTIEERPGDRCPDLATAQRAALKATAQDLASLIRSMLAAGILVKINGRIVPTA